MTRDFDSVGAMPFADDIRSRNKTDLKDPVESALSSIDRTLRMLRAAADQPPLPPSDMKSVAPLAEAPTAPGHEPRSRAVTCASWVAAMFAVVALFWPA